MTERSEHTIVGKITNIYSSGPEYTIVAITANQRPRPNPRKASDTPKIKRVRCKLTAGDYQIGQLLEVTGHYIAVNGHQLIVSTTRPIERHSKDYAAYYLASEWMGILEPSEANRAAQQLGADAVTKLLQSPELIYNVKGLLKARKEKIHRALTAGKEIYSTLQALDNIHVPYPIAIEAQQEWGYAALSMVTNNPHALMEFGAEWEDIDNIRQALNIPEYSPKHLNALIFEAFRRAAQDGHSYLPAEGLNNYVKDITNHNLELSAALEFLTATGALISPHDQCYAFPGLHIAEHQIAQRIKLLIERPVDSTITQEALQSILSTLSLPHTLTEEQTKAVHLALTSGMSVITGGPGTGKTLTLEALTKAASALGLAPLLMAPTGKAAQRLASITKHKATTIHVALRPIKHGWHYNKSNPLSTQLVIIDEASMLDIELAVALFDALPAEARIVFVGDVNQLPSVGAGNILADIIDSQTVPTAALTKTHRQNKRNTIPATAQQLLEGSLPDLQEPADANCKNVMLVTQTDPKQIYSSIRTLINSLANIGIPQHEVQVLSPTKQTPLGTERLNEELKPHQRNGFWEGDRVVQLTNNYAKHVVNGDTGTVIERGTKGHTDYVVVDFGHTQATFTEHTFHEISHAYALTVHKSQGSEYAATIIVLHPTMLSSQAHGQQLVSRSLLYTALTRAKQYSIIISTKATLAKIITADSNPRYTWLYYFLRPDEL